MENFLGYSDVCLLNEENSYILVDTFNISPTNTLFLLDFCVQKLWVQPCPEWITKTPLSDYGVPVTASD